MIFDTNIRLDFALALNRGVVGRVSPGGCGNLFEVTRHVGLKHDLRTSEQSGYKP